MAVIVVLVVLVFGAFLGLLFWLTVAASLLKSKVRKKALAEAPATLDAAFDGREDVTFEVTDMTLPMSKVIAGATERGYRVRTQIAATKTSSTVVFEKVR